MVHGIGQRQLGPAELGSAWRLALSDGVWKAGDAVLAERLLRPGGAVGAVDCRMAFYADLFDRSGVQGAGDGLDGLSVEQTALACELAAVWLQAAADSAGLGADQQAAQAELARLASTFGQELGARNAARTALAGLARLRWFAPTGMAFAQRFVNRALVEVTRYLTEPGLRAAVQARVSEHLAADTTVLIGHSLGSVIAYEAACRHGGALPLLLTLGSPLGVRTLIYDRLLPAPPVFPPTTQAWVNIAAGDDIVAAVPDLTALFAATVPAGARWQGGLTVDNGATPHQAEHYLTKPQTGHQISTVLR